MASAPGGGCAPVVSAKISQRVSISNLPRGTDVVVTPSCSYGSYLSEQTSGVNKTRCCELCIWRA